MLLARLAHVATAAARKGGTLLEGAEQLDPAARALLVEKGAQPLRRGEHVALRMLGQLLRVEVARVPRKVRITREQCALRRRPIAPSATNLLIVILDGLGRAVVHHVPDVGLVDAHPKRDRRDDHARLSREEAQVRLLALALVE